MSWRFPRKVNAPWRSYTNDEKLSSGTTFGRVDLSTSAPGYIFLGSAVIIHWGLKLSFQPVMSEGSGNCLIELFSPPGGIDSILCGIDSIGRKYTESESALSRRFSATKPWEFRSPQSDLPEKLLLKLRSIFEG